MYYEFFLQNVVLCLFLQTSNLHHNISSYVILIKIVFFYLMWFQLTSQLIYLSLVPLILD